MANSGDAEQLYSPSANQDSFYDTIGESTSPEYDNAVNNSLPTTPIDPEEKERQDEEWRKELAKLEDEILTLRQVLSAKLRQSGDLKRKLGITPMVELKQDLKQGITNIKETDAYQKTSATIYNVSDKVTSSDAYQKTNQTLKNVGQKTSSTFSAIGSFTSRKIGDMRNSNAFKSFEEKVGGAVSNVKGYVRSKSTSEEEESTELTSTKEGATADDSGFNSPANGEKAPLVPATPKAEDAKAPK